jgi:transmembrane sensor
MESSTRIEEIAASWIARRDSAAFSAADAEQLEHWLQASIAHRVAFVRLDAAWRQANRLKALGAGVSPGHVPEPGEWRQSPYFERRAPATDPALEAGAASEPETMREDSGPSGRSKLNVAHRSRALAAVLLLALAAGLGWYLWPGAPSYRTEVGGLAAVPMSDGSKITLNTDSVVRVAVSEAERRVELDQGEAFFEVAQDARRPFVVRVGSRRVIAVGTKFSVRRDAEELRVVVTEGRVRVEKDVGDTITQLPAGAVARTGGGGVLVQRKSIPQVEELLSWRSGFVVFHQTALADAVAELNRYNTRKIVIADPSVAALRISGNFRATNVEAFARLLEQGFSIRALTNDENIVLSAD